MKVQPRSLLVGVLLIFVLYAIIVSPQDTADFVRTIFVFIGDAFRSIFTFFDALLRR